MAEEGTFATNAEVLRKAGAGASSTATAEAYTNDFIKQAESYINVMCRYNFTDNYAGLNEDVKLILKEAASNIAAMYCISYDMSGFTSRTEAETMLDFLRDAANRCLKLLADTVSVTYMKGA